MIDGNHYVKTACKLSISCVKLYVLFSQNPNFKLKLITPFKQCIKLAEMSTGPYGPVDAKSTGPMNDIFIHIA